MESESTILSRGRITIPIEIRTLLGLKPGDKVTYELTDNGIMMRRDNNSET